MNFQDFQCGRNYIESIYRKVQRDISIQLYCADQFNSINLVDFYYRKTESNAILMFMFICVIYPILFLCIANIADKYLATGMQDLSSRFGLSATIAAVTLIAFANGAPDVISSLSAGSQEDGALMALGATLGGFIFSTTLVVTNVVYNSKKEIVLPKLEIYKELGFYTLSLIVLCIFGFIGKTGYPFIGVYLSLYIIYIMISIFIDKMKKEELVQEEIIEDIDIKTQNILTVNESRAFETPIEIQEVDPNINKKSGFMSKIIDEIVEEESSGMQNMVLMPLNALGLITVCYLDNPLMKSYLKYLVIGVSLVFMIYFNEFFELSWIGFLILGISSAIIFLLLEMVHFNKNILEIIYEIVSVFAAVGWISIFANLIIDFITFLSFYFSIDKVILSSILLSAGNTIGDFFGNAALAKQGEEIMGAFASYSGQLFTNFIGFSANVYAITKAGDPKFDVFGIHREEGTSLPLKNIFLMIVMGTTLMIIIFTFFKLTLGQFKLTKAFTSLLMIIYLVFFSCSMIFGVLSRE